MKTKKEEITARSAYKRYTSQFKEQALERADRDGIPKVAQDLGIAEATLYAWRTKCRQTGQPFEDQNLQQAEMSGLKRENARLEEVVAFLIPTRGTRKGGGVFANVSKQDFASLLRGLAKKEILTQTPTGLLLHGPVGEKLVNHYSFYAAFSADEEFRLVCGGKTLGSLPLSQPVEEGSYLIFAGKRWRVQSLNTEKQIIVVIPAQAGKVPQFDGSGVMVDDGVRQEMQQVLLETGHIAFLDAPAQQLLQDARATFSRMKLDTEIALIGANNVQLFLWQGDRIMNTIVLMLKQRDFNAENAGLYINIKTSHPEKLFEALRDLAASSPPDPISLVAKVMNKWLAKWDNLLPDELLARNYSSHMLDVLGGHQVIKRF